MNRKKVIKYKKRNTDSPSISVVWLCFAVIILSANWTLAELQKNNLDPTDIMDAHLNENKNNNRQPEDMTFDLKPVAIKIQENSTSPANFAANDTVSDALTSARITTPVENNSESKSELKNLIDQINSVKIKKSSAIHLGAKKEKTNSEKKLPQNTNNDILQNEVNKIFKEPYESFTIDNGNFTKNNFADSKKHVNLKAETIKLVNDLINNPESFNSFFELGEIMFECGMLSEAYVFYKQALDTTDKNDEETKSWILFQTANCLRNTDYSKAIEYYKALITDFPHCEWAEFAKDQIELLNWYLNDDPQGLIRKSSFLVE